MNGTLTDPSQYCELHAHSSFSLLDGVPFPEQIAERAAALGMVAAALTDHDGVYGLVPFYRRAKELNIKPILGSELTLDDDSHITLLAETNEGYSHLCQLIAEGRLNAKKGKSKLPWGLLPRHAHGLICLTGCRRGPVARHVANNNLAEAKRSLSLLMEIFGRRNIYVELQRLLQRNDMRISRNLAALARERNLPVVATGNVHYFRAEEADLQIALTSIHEQIPLPKLGKLLRSNRERFMRPATGMAALFPDELGAVKTTRLVAERCNAELPMGLQLLPQMPTPNSVSADDYLQLLCNHTLPTIYPRNSDQARELLEKELGIIREMRLANYFLVVWDIVAFCKKNHILCHGRGSAANSIVARLLGISAVDPISQGLVVERFLHEHGGPPDIDLDLEAGDKRERVVQYVFERWGRDCAAFACTFITYRSRSSIRDAGFALGFKPETIKEIGGSVEHERRAQELDEDGQVEHEDTPIDQLKPPTDKMTSAEWKRLVSLATQLQRRPRHLGMHPSGMVITGHPIASLIPIEPASMPGRQVVQFSKVELEDLGIVKIDLLGLRMLAAIADTIWLVGKTKNKGIDLYQLCFDDKAVYDLICSAKTIGLFQVESGAQVSVIPSMQPRCFQDLVVEVSLIRPGPMQGGMVRPYIRRRRGEEPVRFLHPLLKPALAETLAG